MKKNILLGLLLTGLLSIGSTATANTGSLEEQIKALSAQIAELQTKLVQLKGQQGQEGQAWCHTFATNLRIGDHGDEIRALQMALGKEASAVANDEEGGSNFGESTAAEIVRFQAKHNIIQTGFVGPLTRKALNALYECKDGTHPPVAVSPITKPPEQKKPMPLPAPMNTSSDAKMHPSITSISPVGALEGSGNTEVGIYGTGFTDGSKAAVKTSMTATNDQAITLTTVFVSSTQLKVIVPQSMLRNEATLYLYVVNPTTGASNAVAFTVTSNTQALLQKQSQVSSILAGFLKLLGK